VILHDFFPFSSCTNELYPSIVSLYLFSCSLSLFSLLTLIASTLRFSSLRLLFSLLSWRVPIYLIKGGEIYWILFLLKHVRLDFVVLSSLLSCLLLPAKRDTRSQQYCHYDFPVRSRWLSYVDSLIACVHLQLSSPVVFQMFRAFAGQAS
jgi:hypothetical protein